MPFRYTLNAVRRSEMLATSCPHSRVVPGLTPELDLYSIFSMDYVDCPLIPTGNFQIDAKGQDFCFDLFHYFIHEGAVSKVIITEIC